MNPGTRFDAPSGRVYDVCRQEVNLEPLSPLCCAGEVCHHAVYHNAACRLIGLYSRINCDAGMLIKGADTDVGIKVVGLPRIDTFWRT